LHNKNISKKKKSTNEEVRGSKKVKCKMIVWYYEYSYQSFRNLQYWGCDCTEARLNCVWVRDGIVLLNYTCQRSSCCASAIDYLRWRVHGVDERITDWNGQQRPPNHCFIDVNSPAHQQICSYYCV